MFAAKTVIVWWSTSCLHSNEPKAAVDYSSVISQLPPIIANDFLLKEDLMTEECVLSAVHPFRPP